ncbi:MAG: hypothetical protein IPN67_17065 [Bacteroidales bacterium]|nr:hypothetical protein [Bacteroidales bacterium]
MEHPMEMMYLLLTSNIVLPSVYTLDANATSLTTATSGGNIADDGGGIITERGLCYSTGNYSPTTDDNKIICGNGTGNFSAELTGLNMLSTYLIRAYAINSEGTSYGNQVIFKTVNYICSGSGWDGATGYDSTKAGIHPILSTNNIIPVEWQPSSPELTELIACDITNYILLQSCLYANGWTVNRYRVLHYVTIRETRTGAIIDQKSFSGSDPETCPASISSSSPNIYGSFNDSQIINWLQKYVVK